jgi:hypothetical protein
MTEPRPGHPAEDDLVELALGSRPADESSIAAHLGDCPSCRAAYDEIVRALDAVLPASPAVGPPAGFEDRVLAAIRAPAGEAPAGQAPPSQAPASQAPASQAPASQAPDAPVAPRPRRGRLLVAAAAVAGLAVGAVIGATTRDPAPESTRAAALVTAGGDTVGDVLTGSYEGAEVLVLRVEDGPPGKHYACRLRLEDGSTRAAGEWDVPASGEAVWVTQAPEGTTRVELVTDAGEVWSSARIED